MIMAMAPPSTKNTIAVIMYMYAMVLWSVLVIHLTKVRPTRCWRGGRGAGAVTGVIVGRSLRVVILRLPHRWFGRFPVIRSDRVP